MDPEEGLKQQKKSCGGRKWNSRAPDRDKRVVRNPDIIPVGIEKGRKENAQGKKGNCAQRIDGGKKNSQEEFCAFDG